MIERAALIVGAASGMGRATARKLASRGISVTLADMNKDRVSDVAKEIESTFGVRTASVGVNITREQEVKDMVEHATSLTGSLDYAANCAGICESIWKEERSISTELFDQTYAVNARGLWLCQKYEAQKMQTQEPKALELSPAPASPIKKQRGSIANIASISGLHAIGLAAYTPSKYAAAAITKNGAKFYGPDGIRCNALCPGWTLTTMIEHSMGKEGTLGTDENKNSPVNDIVALGRMGFAEEQASVMSFLLSDESSYLNGALIVSDGGYHDIR